MNWGQNATRKKWTFRTQTDNGLPGGAALRSMAERVSGVGVDDDSWHHVAAVLSGANLNSLTLYLDGQPLGNSCKSGGGTIQYCLPRLASARISLADISRV